MPYARAGPSLKTHFSDITRHSLATWPTSRTSANKPSIGTKRPEQLRVNRAPRAGPGHEVSCLGRFSRCVAQLKSKHRRGGGNLPLQAGAMIRHTPPKMTHSIAGRL